MKDEEMAEEYANKAHTHNILNWEKLKQAFLAGLKAGRPQWHKVADGDLPEEFDKPYLCKVYGHFEVGYFTAYKEQPWHFDEYYLDNESVIAWCEIPQFKE